jgi:hypothetical protein
MWSDPYYEVVCWDGARWLLHSAYPDRNDAMHCAKTLERRPMRVRVQAERLNEASGEFRGMLVYESGRPPRDLRPKAKPAVALPRPPRRPARRPGLLERLLALLAGPAMGASQGRVLASG